MNTHLWASMEADSGGELPAVYSLDWVEVATAQARYLFLENKLTVDHLTSLYRIIRNIAPKVDGYVIDAS